MRYPELALFKDKWSLLGAWVVTTTTKSAYLLYYTSIAYIWHLKWQKRPRNMSKRGCSQNHFQITFFCPQFCKVSYATVGSTRFSMWVADITQYIPYTTHKFIILYAYWKFGIMDCTICTTMVHSGYNIIIIIIICISHIK